MNPKHVRRLLRTMGLEAVYPKPRLSQAAPGHRIYPYLLRGMTIDRPNQVWSTDITYIRLARGFVYLVAILDWYSRYVLAWSVSNTLDSLFCMETLRQALAEYGQPAGERSNLRRLRQDRGDAQERADTRPGPQRLGLTRPQTTVSQ
ncbi:MAG: DDE-type integrase/transposase/recombinase [Planctomycetota bacterium]|nr:DDE-type integrase/transposase/recombinase [Planctomycetota bacterium]